MKLKPYRLLVVAHPDDETIFFSGVILNRRNIPWNLICVTNGNADGRGKERHEELLAASNLLGISRVEQWDYPDTYDTRLPLDEIAARLGSLPSPYEIFTHGPLGEYGHPHHQDICLAVHRAFGSKMKIFSPAWNCNADFAVKLTPVQFKKKTHAFAEIYGKETSRFLNLVPNMPVEGYRRFHTEEVEALVGFLRRERTLNAASLKESAWLEKLLPELRERLKTRLF